MGWDGMGRKRELVGFCGVRSDDAFVRSGNLRHTPALSGTPAPFAIGHITDYCGLWRLFLECKPSFSLSFGAWGDIPRVRVIFWGPRCCLSGVECCHITELRSNSSTPISCPSRENASIPGLPTGPTPFLAPVGVLGTKRYIPAPCPLPLPNPPSGAILLCCE